MKIVIRVELITDRGDAKTIEVGRIDRPSQMLDAESVGLSMAEGKQLLHNLQQAVIPAQADEICRRNLHRAAHLSTMPSLDGVEGLPATQSGYRVWYRQLPQPTHCVVRLRAALVFGDSVLHAMDDHTGARHAGVVGPSGETRSADVVSTSGRDDSRIPASQ